MMGMFGGEGEGVLVVVVEENRQIEKEEIIKSRKTENFSFNQNVHCGKRCKCPFFKFILKKRTKNKQYSKRIIKKTDNYLKKKERN